MTRRDLLSSGSGLLAGMPRAGAAVAGRPKNVLLLMSDQHRPHALGIDGDPYAKTPNLDGLAREGVRFDQTYCTNPVCTPARASILTGLYTHNHRTWSNAVPWPFEIKTLAHHFGRAGYMSALVGKMHFVDAQTHGFDYRLDFNDWYQYLGPKTKLYADELGRANSGSGLPQIDDLWRDFGDPWLEAREKDGRKGSVHIGRASKIAERDHFDSFIARETVRYLKNFGKKQPFFLVSSFLKPHDPYMPPERFARMFPSQSVQLPATWGKVDPEKVPREIRRRIELDAPTPEIAGADAARMRIAMYYANLAHLDDCLGQVLRGLAELGLEEDTLVIYTSDHGEMLGEHGLWNKFVFYEPSAGVPLIFRVPGRRQANARCATPVSHTELAATLLELCGVETPAGLDGGSLVSLLAQPGTARDVAVYSEYGLRTKGAKYMIRRGDFKYSFYVNDTAELYNVREDPGEMKNLALLAEYREKAEEMKGQLFAWHKPPEMGV